MTGDPDTASREAVVGPWPSPEEWTSAGGQSAGDRGQVTPAAKYAGYGRPLQQSQRGLELIP
jgi:hypothetical protein